MNADKIKTKCVNAKGREEEMEASSTLRRHCIRCREVPQTPRPKKRAPKRPLNATHCFPDYKW